MSTTHGPEFRINRMTVNVEAAVVARTFATGSWWAGPCLSLIARVFSLTAAVRDGYFTFLGTCWSLDATLREKSP